MTKEQHVAKAVLGHDWANLEDWVSALDELADLRDEQAALFAPLIDRREVSNAGPV